MVGATDESNMLTLLIERHTKSVGDEHILITVEKMMHMDTMVTGRHPTRIYLGNKERIEAYEFFVHRGLTTVGGGFINEHLDGDGGGACQTRKLHRVWRIACC